jgi:uncharacterized protein (TIRG00374 family)
VLKITVSAGLLAFLLAKGGIGKLLHTLAHTSPSWLALGFAFGVVGAFVTITQWHALLRASDVNRSWARCFRIEWACDFFDAALPSSIGGDVMRAVFAAHEPEERVKTASSVVLRRLLNFPGMIVVMLIGLLASLHLRYVGRVAPYASAAIVAGIVGLAVAATPFARWLGRTPLLQRFGPGRAVGKLLHELDGFRGNRRAIFGASLRGTVFWCVVVLSQWSYMRAMGIHAPLVYAAVVVTCINAITMLPLSLGGYGVREGGFSAFLAVAGLATVAQGIGVGLCITAQTMAFGLIGLPVYLTMRHRPHPAASTPVSPLDDATIELATGVA